MNGSRLYVMPATTAPGVDRTRKSSPSSPRSLSGPNKSPLSARMVSQEIVRSRKLVKNGAMTRNSRRLLYRPPLNAIVYASG